MGGFDRRGYMPTTREPARESGLSSVAGLARPLLAIAVVGVVVFIGYKLLKSASAAADASANDAQLAQMGQRMGDSGASPGPTGERAQSIPGAFQARSPKLSYCHGC